MDSHPPMTTVRRVERQRQSEIRVTVSGIVAVAVLAAVTAVVMASSVGSSFRTFVDGDAQRQTPSSSLGVVERP